MGSPCGCRLEGRAAGAPGAPWGAGMVPVHGTACRWAGAEQELWLDCRAGLPHHILPNQPVLQHGPELGAVVIPQQLPEPHVLELLPAGPHPHR